MRKNINEEHVRNTQILLLSKFSNITVIVLSNYLPHAPISALNFLYSTKENKPGSDTKSVIPQNKHASLFVVS